MRLSYCVLLMCVLLSSCSSSVEPEPTSILGNWYVAKLDDTASTGITHLTIRGDSIIVHRNMSCQIHHVYTRHDDSINARVTLNACGDALPALIDLENGASVRSKGDSLVIVTKKHTITLVRLTATPVSGITGIWNIDQSFYPTEVSAGILGTMTITDTTLVLNLVQDISGTTWQLEYPIGTPMDAGYYETIDISPAGEPFGTQTFSWNFATPFIQFYFTGIDGLNEITFDARQ